MQIACLILAHKNINQIARLANAVAHDNVTVFLHIDASLEFIEKDFEDQLDTNANIYFLEPRIRAKWGGFSLVEITVHLLEACAKYGTFDYVSLISGQDFPLLNYNSTVNVLEKNYGAEYLLCTEATDSNTSNGYFGLDRFEKYWLVDEIGLHESKVFVDLQRQEGVKRNIPYNLTPYGGSQWFTITGNCTNYILDFLNTHPQYLPFFKYTLAPDEMFFPTIIMNSKFKSRAIENNNLRFINWIDGPQYPKVLSMQDTNVFNTGSNLFARKFDIEIDSQILLELEKLLKQ